MNLEPNNTSTFSLYDKFTIDQLPECYHNWFKEYEDLAKRINLLSINEMNETELDNYLIKFQNLYNQISDLHYEFAKIKPIHYRDIDVLDFIKKSEIHINRIQFRYLYPIDLKLSKFSEIRSKTRDYCLFGAAIIISVIISLFTTDLTNVLKIKSNDNVQKKIEMILSNQKKLDSINCYLKDINLKIQNNSPGNAILINKKDIK